MKDQPGSEEQIVLVIVTSVVERGHLIVCLKQPERDCSADWETDASAQPTFKSVGSISSAGNSSPGVSRADQ